MTSSSIVNSGFVNILFLRGSQFTSFIVGNENGEPVIAERQIRIMDKPLGHRDYDEGIITCNLADCIQFNYY